MKSYTMDFVGQKMPQKLHLKKADPEQNGKMSKVLMSCIK